MNIVSLVLLNDLFPVDETTKEFKVFPNAKRDLREIAKETGIAYEEMILFNTDHYTLGLSFKTVPGSTRNI